MWTRRQLKERGKATFKANYWKTVLVALILTVLAGGVSAGSFGSFGGDMLEDGIVSSDGSSILDGHRHHYRDPFEDDDLDFFDEWDGYDLDIDDGPAAAGVLAFIIGVLAVVAVIALVAIAISALVDILLVNPLTVGIYRFFVVNLRQPAETKEVAFGFDHNYKSMVKTMFFRDLYTILWSLLFIVPGIIKYYEYRMIPYLLAEHPEMTKDEAFAVSKQMMNGQKWNTFVLDLSFIGWDILSALTCGILEIFYVGPYRNMTIAALYDTLKYQPQPQDPRYYQIPPQGPQAYGQPQPPQGPAPQNPMPPVQTRPENVPAEPAQNPPEESPQDPSPDTQPQNPQDEQPM